MYLFVPLFTPAKRPVMSALTGPINNRHKKSDLEDIAHALEIDSTGTMKVLIPHIITHLDKHPQLAKNVKFQGLFSYCPDSIPTEKKTKKSSDKVAEDECKAKIAVGKPTGYVTAFIANWLNTNFSVFRANKTLLDLKVTTDPPPQFGRLCTTGATVHGGPVAPGGMCHCGSHSCSFKLISNEDGDMGKESSPTSEPDLDNGTSVTHFWVPMRWSNSWN